MPEYRFQARLSSGQVHAGTMTAESAQVAAAVLRNQGHHVLQIQPVRGSLADMSKRLNKALSYSFGPSQKDILDFTTKLAVMIRAGISLRAALEGIADQTANAKFRTILTTIRSDVESGKQFSEAIARYPKLFNPLYVNMVRASEMAGSFATMLDRIAAYIAQQLETRKMVVGASIYPGIIATMAIGVTVFLLTFVLPRFEGVFAGKEALLPWPTVFLMGASDFLINFWWALIAALLAVVVAGVFFLKTEVGMLWFDNGKLTMPVMCRMFRALYVSRSLHTMGELLNAGVPMLDTIAITGDISGNLLFKKMWRNVYASVKQGKKVVSTLQKSSLLPRSVVQMIAAGEESGRLGEVLEEISTYYQKTLRDAIKAVTGMIEPIMIVLMGSIVGLIAMAIILPIFKMSNMVQ